MLVTPPIDDSVKRVQRSLDNLSRAFDNASNNAIDKATESLIGLVKSSDVFNDNAKRQAKNLKSAEAALKSMAKEADRLSDILENNIEISALTRQTMARNLKQHLVRMDAMSAEIDKVTKELSTVGSKFGKVLDLGRGKVTEFAAKTLTATFALGKLKEGAELIYKSGVKLANKGLLSSMGQITTSALMLRMGAEEFIELIDKNRDTVMALGGGAKGIEAFEDNIRKSSDGLAYMGKDGKKAVATWMGSFIRSGGTIDEYVRSSKGLNSQFETLQKTVGTTVDEFAEYIEEINNSQMIQAKLNLGDKAAAQQLRQEAMARTDQYAALQLTTKQMVVMNKTLESMYNPNKNKQAEIIKQREYAKIAIRSTSAEMRKAGRTADADKLDEGFTNGSIDALLKGGDASKDPKLMATARSLENMRAFNAEARAGDGASMKNYLGVEMADRSEILQQIQSVGAIGNQADNAKGKNQGQNYKDQKAEALKQGIGTEIFTGVRAGVEAASAAMNTMFTPAVLGASAALALLATSSTAAAFAKGAGGMIKRGGAAAARGGMAAGRGALAMGSRALPLLGPLGAVAGAGTAGYYGAKGAMDLMGVDPGKLGSGLYDILHPDPNAKKPSSPQSASIMPRSAGGASGSGAKANEQIMARALADAGVTDPKQKAILMGQLAHESGGFKYTKELGNDSYFSKYDGRKSLGNTQQGDGARYKGRGFIQLTGRANYADAGKALGLDLINSPELAEQPEVAAKIAVWYLQKKKRGGTAIDMAKQGDLMGVTAHINGGYNGLQDRQARTNNYMQQYAQVNKDPLAPSTALAAVPTTSTEAPVLTSDKMIAQYLATIANNTTRRLGDGNHGKQDKRSAMEVA